MPFDFLQPFQLHGIIFTIGWLDVLDILVVAVILYKVYEMLADTRAITLVKGILVLLGITLACSALNLHAISWLLQKTVTLLFVALPIVFQPELRRGLEHLGQGRFLGPTSVLNDEEAHSVVNELAKAVKQLAHDKTGALLVIERDMGLNDISATGIQIDALITADFLLNVFIPNTPLHDGAAIIRGKRLIAELGTRHRAAIGLSEQCDALIVVVSEETGTISVAENGRIVRHLDIDTLKAILQPAFVHPNTGIKDFVNNWRNKK